VSRNNAKILIVEDAEDMLWLIGNVLEQEEFSVDEATMGAEAIRKLKESPETELIILNYQLPDMNGLNVMKQARKNGCSAKFIVISGFATKEVRDIFLSFGVFALLEKPFDIRELANLCKQALSKRSAFSGIPLKNHRERR